MRVISGTWKGRRLTAPSGRQVRPTTDRVKEAIFNILGPRVRDARVLDLCCGTGALGIEALSRGAAGAVFVDTSGLALSATEKNLIHCGADPSTYNLVRADTQVFWTSEMSRTSASPWLFLCDPPYASQLAQWMLEESGNLAGNSSCLGGVVEFGNLEPQLASSGISWEFRTYGKTILALFLPGRRD